jgi:hypothetical protein
MADNWEHAQLQALDASMLSAGWTQLDPSTNALANQYRAYMPGLWKANRAGESITLKFKGSTLLIYDLLGPDCGQVSVQIDNLPPYTVPLFDAFSTYHRLGTLSVANSMPDGIHTAVITLLPNQPDKLTILHQRKENAGITELNPKTYNDTAFYAGAVLVLGDLVRK